MALPVAQMAAAVAFLNTNANPVGCSQIAYGTDCEQLLH